MLKFRHYPPASGVALLRLWTCLAPIVGGVGCVATSPERPSSDHGHESICVANPTWFMRVLALGMSEREYVFSNSEVSEIRIARHPWFGPDWDERSVEQWQCVELTAEEAECARITLECARGVVASGESFAFSSNDEIQIEDLRANNGFRWAPFSALSVDCRTAVDCLIGAIPDEGSGSD